MYFVETELKYFFLITPTDKISVMTASAARQNTSLGWKGMCVVALV